MGAKAATGIEKKGTHDPTTAIFSLAGLCPAHPAGAPGPAPDPGWGSAPDPAGALPQTPFCKSTLYRGGLSV